MPPGGKQPSPQVSQNPLQRANEKHEWNAEEDKLMLMLRGEGMKWRDVSQQLPGRSAIACRLRYQNYIEKRADWSEESKDRLSMLYER
ncbi:hypothetical protein JDV02_001416 [Purpureocillium takamizusanense]|uniref:MYB transcription factor n=1 Tax=Purpureocillium takamizusanense TaxID=2060973 RepID=A0A9Q8V7G3_9HYPO|nr:uncharacterized protein JDV02_001416 [Purpureocillium takamizusanense]UNI14824.1 hypothetical protein JDV02_001416 [Purpureocillium takamizusanense]